MRMLLKARIPTEAGNQTIKNGTMEKTLMSALDALAPEAAYFFPDEGVRTCFLVFDMERSSQLPSVAETFFLEFGAKVDVTPVMNLEDLQTGLGELMATR
ncbi:hypothetical protein [Streptomyces sp. 8N706]|uniref:hypothetical protein n=1 Tax=Streptomyces sp. 8N706 TaxID=3457416 RepID=UPI003FD6A112